MNRYLKFGIPVAAILATLVWLAFSSTKETAEYFVKIPEIKKLGDDARARRLQVDGYVKEGSIVTEGRSTRFLLVENEGKKDVGQQLQVIYTGDDARCRTLLRNMLKRWQGDPHGRGRSVASEQDHRQVRVEIRGRPPSVSASKPSSGKR